VAAGLASASHLDPKRAITPADQARARAMQLRASDLVGAYQPLAGGRTHVTCKGLDQSDLTVTGEAKLKNWLLAPTFVNSGAVVFASVRDAEASWSRQVGPAGLRCALQESRRAAARTGGTVRSIRRVPFPRLAPKTASYRVLAALGPQGPLLANQVVALQRARAQAYFSVTTLADAPMPQSELVRLARLVAGRMAKAMRGG